tara:strand:- start:117 stop:374 length:258 start_codon:yes stop_codon:yes gene_type:complete
MRVRVKKRYGIEFENGKSLENNGYKKEIFYISHFKCVKSRFLLYKNDFKIQIGFKVVVKKGTNKIKSILQTIDSEHDTINFKIKK